MMTMMMKPANLLTPIKKEPNDSGQEKAENNHHHTNRWFPEKVYHNLSKGGKGAPSLPSARG